MFSSFKSSAFDEPVAKATDENLPSENWEFILDVCDSVGPSDSDARDVISAVEKRLSLQNPKIQLYALEMANSLVQNCSINVHKEIASKHFADVLLRLAINPQYANDSVKSKIYERLEEWTQLFADNPELEILSETFQIVQMHNPGLKPPSRPQKQEISDADRQREQEDLRRALELSTKESSSPLQEQRQHQQRLNHASSSSLGQQQQQQQQTEQEQQATEQPGQQDASVTPGISAATISRVRALFTFKAREPGELGFNKGDIIVVLESAYKYWWRGSLNGVTGIFPLNYVEKLTDPSPEELAKEAEAEAAVFGQIKNVEKLLTLLSTTAGKPGGKDGGGEGSVSDNEEITRLYHSTLAMRPKLIDLIGKYTQRKEELTQLNEKFVKSSREYETLLEASMANPSAAAYNHNQPTTLQTYAPHPPSTAPSYPPPQHQQQPPSNASSTFHPLQVQSPPTYYAMPHNYNP